MNMSMIRPYKSSDREHLISVFKLNTPKYFDPAEVEDFLNYLKRFSKTYYTIEFDGKVIGGIGYNLRENDKSGRITWVFLSPSYTSMGIGKKAVEYCLEKLNENVGVQKYIVTTSQFAFAFFKKFGFRTIRIEKDYWGKGLDLYEMEKSAL